MTKDGVLVNRRTALLITAAAFLASFMGFGWLLHSLHHEGIKTRTERLYYLPYQLVQAEQAKLDEARVPIKLQSREIELGIYEHTLEIQSSVGESLARMSELGLELSAPADWDLISADVTFQGDEGTKKTPDFSSAEQKKQGTNNSILLKAIPGAQKANPGAERGLLTIKSTGAPELSVWVQKSSGKPVSPILWTLMPNTEGDPVYASLSGWFRYSEEGVPSYSRAQLLASTWGLGVAGNRVIYTLVGIAFLLWISGIGLLLVPDLMSKVIPQFLAEAIGCSLILSAICVIFSFIFPPFHGPDETNHFLTYTKIAGKESLEKGALELANQGTFQKIHRRPYEKFASSDLREKSDENWPAYGGGPYPLDRSPLERTCWKVLGHLMPHEKASAIIFQLRVANGLFVAGCFLLALAVAGSIFREKLLTPWFAAPVLLIPCVAHYSTVISNYPFLIGGYVIQMVVLGALWVSLDSPMLSRRHLAQIGALLGSGLALALCSADNALVTLPFWGVILPGYFMARSASDETWVSQFKDTGALLVAMIGTLFLICVSIAPFCINHSFLPGMTSSKLAQLLPVHGSLLLAGIALLVIYGAGISATTLLLCGIRVLLKNVRWNLPWRPLGGMALIVTVILLVLCKYPSLPDIDLSRGKNTTAMRYAVDVAGAFADSLLPGKPDEMAETFWRRLGWQETELPRLIMDILRIGVGFGIILLFWKSFSRKEKGRIAAFAVTNVIGLAICIATIAALYYAALFNVNSRYILIAYLFATLLASEGYRRCLHEKMKSRLKSMAILASLLVIDIGIQSWSWVTILNRYF